MTDTRTRVRLVVELSEPADAHPIEWDKAVASMLRLYFKNTTVQVEEVSKA